MKFHAIRREPQYGEQKTSFWEEEVDAWHWLMKWPDAPNSEEVPTKFHDVAGMD